MNKHLGICLIALLALTGCKQDPYDGYSDNVKNGTAPGSQKPTPQPKYLDAFLDTSGFLAFAEGVEGKFKVTVRVLNLDDKIGWKLGVAAGPKDAKYDPVSGNLTWTPPIGTTGSAYFTTDTIKFRVETTSSPYSYKDFDLGFIVTKATQTPEVIRVDGLSAQVSEGERRAFRVVVKDISANTNFLPKLMLFPTDSTLVQNGAAYIKPVLGPSGVVPGANGEWAFNYYVDGTDPVTREPMELSRGISEYGFTLRAYSAVGVPSQDVNSKFTAVNVARKPIVSFGNTPLTVKAGERVTFGFSIYTKHGDGNLQWNVSQLPGAVATCTRASPSSDLFDCSVQWAVPSPAAASYNLHVSVLNTVNVNPGQPPTTAQTDVDRAIAGQN